MTKEERQEIERTIRERAAEYLKPDKSGKGYICPICGSGSGKNGTGITTKDGVHFTCWSHECFQNADIFDIIGKQFNLTDFNEIFQRACEIFGISLDTARQSSTQTQADLLTQAAANIESTDYHRGLSLYTLKKFKIGFISEWRVSEKAPFSPRLIIPNDGGGYLARDTRTNLTEQQAKFSKIRQGKTALFNSAALNQTLEPVFVVEGEIDALSINDAGGESVALCSVTNAEKLIEVLKNRRSQGFDIPPLIILLDNDIAGQAATKKLIDGLKEINFFSYRQVNLPAEYKDANEFLMADKSQFNFWIIECKNFDFDAAKIANQNQEIFSEMAFTRLENFSELVKRNREGTAISTGLKNFDEVLDGGFYPGLYTIGANSSIGKTIFALQIADFIASSNYPVLYISLEMSANELIARSLSRLSFINAGGKIGAKSTRGILIGDYNNTESANVFVSMKQYRETISKNLFFVEGVGDIHVNTIKQKINEVKNVTQKSPVVVIDYLQIIAPYEKGLTDKQNTDKNITELKRLSRDYGLPIFGISSFNRESYKEPVSMASFKESGAIEYSSDVLIALQYDGYDYQDGDNNFTRTNRLRKILQTNSELAKNGDSQRIQAKILKNRNGIRKDIYFDLFPKFNLFVSKD